MRAIRFWSIAFLAAVVLAAPAAVFGQAELPPWEGRDRDGKVITLDDLEEALYFHGLWLAKLKSNGYAIKDPKAWPPALRDDPRRAQFEGAGLRRSDFRGAKLSGAVFSFSNLSGAVLGESDL